MEWSIREVAAQTGLTSRTLRHWDRVGLLTPSRTGPGGLRFYDSAALVRLQRVLAARELGMPLAQIHEVLSRDIDEVAALRRHLEALRMESARIDRLIGAVGATISALERGEEPMPEHMFDGFDHEKYREEVRQRWGDRADRDSNEWWTSMGDAERRAWFERSQALGQDWIRVASDPAITPDSPEAQEVAGRHVDWLRSIPGTPSYGAANSEGERHYVLSLADMYVADERFSANYGGTDGAIFVRDALRALLGTAS